MPWTQEPPGLRGKETEQSLRYRLGFRVEGLGFRALGFGFRGLGFRVLGLRFFYFRILGFRVLGLVFRLAGSSYLLP